MANNAAPKQTVAKVSFSQKVGKFIKECYNEVRFKSSWPSSEELKQYTIVVLVAVAIVSIWIAGFDFIIGRVTRWLEIFKG